MQCRKIQRQRGKKVEKRCTVCDTPMEQGKLEWIGMTTSVKVLQWWSDKPVKIRKSSLFGQEREIERNRSFVLNTEIPGSGGWYCPKCEKIYAAFSVKGQSGL